MTHRIPTLRYRCPSDEGGPPIGCILMGDGPRVRRGYRVLSATKVNSNPAALGVATWRIRVEPMAAASAREEIGAGSPHWSIEWDRRNRRA